MTNKTPIKKQKQEEVSPEAKAPVKVRIKPPQEELQKEYDTLLQSDCKILVAFSGGKDSIAMVLHLLELGIDKARIELHHHDVDGSSYKIFDWICTEQYCIDFAKYLDIPIFFSYREGGIIREAMRENQPRGNVYYQSEVDGDFHLREADQTKLNTRRKFPAVSADLSVRWCSSTVKIDVLKSVLAANPAFKTGNFLVLTGERRAESVARSRYEMFDWHGANTQKRKVLNVRIILDWTDSEVWGIMERHHIQPHPSYMLGWKRCSCQNCIFNSPKIWATSNMLSPEKIKVISMIEKDFNHTLYDKFTLEQVVAKATPIEGLAPYWITQATIRYDAPIYVENWQMPIGAYSKESAGAL